MRSTLASWLFIAVAFVFLAVGAFGTPRRPTFTVIGIAFFVVGFAARRRQRGRDGPRRHEM